MYVKLQMGLLNISLNISDQTGRDEVDAPVEEEEAELCTYMFIDSRDQILLNFSPQAIDVITEVHEVTNYFLSRVSVVMRF